MRFYPIKVREESYELYDYILEGIRASERMSFPEKMTSPYSKAKHFKKHNPQYHKVPNSLLRGNYKFKKLTSDGLMGIRVKGTRIHLWGLGELKLEYPAPPTLGRITGISLRRELEEAIEPTYEVIFHGIGYKGPNPKVVFRDYTGEDFSELVKEDPIFRYLKVNGTIAYHGHKKAGQLHDIIEAFMENPNMTRQQLERLGVRGDKLWDLVVNYQPSLDVILRAGTKPKGMQYKILSKGQHESRMDREWSMAEHLSASDVDAGKLKKQSFDSQTYEALRSDKWSFFQ